MNIPSLECANCGSKQIRRARYKSWSERLGGIFGVHPFRCRRCTHRFSVSVWLFGKLRYAKCPRCLRLELTTWSRRYYKVGFVKSFLIAFGAQKYRCASCRCNFVSFRPRKSTARYGDPMEGGDEAFPTGGSRDEAEILSESPPEPEEGPVRRKGPRLCDKMKSPEPEGSPSPPLVEQVLWPAPVQLVFTSPENEPAPDSAPTAESSPVRNTARKSSASRKKTSPRPGEEANGLSEW